MIEVISILFRPVSLSFRLFGNVFGGENLIVNMMGIFQMGASGPVLRIGTPDRIDPGFGIHHPRRRLHRTHLQPRNRGRTRPLNPFMDG
jgi:hypothetical protein